MENVIKTILLVMTTHFLFFYTKKLAVYLEEGFFNWNKKNDDKILLFRAFTILTSFSIYFCFKDTKMTSGLLKEVSELVSNLSIIIQFCLWIYLFDFEFKTKHLQVRYSKFEEIKSNEKFDNENLDFNKTIREIKGSFNELESKITIHSPNDYDDVTVSEFLQTEKNKKKAKKKILKEKMIRERYEELLLNCCLNQTKEEIYKYLENYENIDGIRFNKENLDKFLGFKSIEDEDRIIWKDIGRNNNTDCNKLGLLKLMYKFYNVDHIKNMKEKIHFIKYVAVKYFKKIDGTDIIIKNGDIFNLKTFINKQLSKQIKI